MKTGGQKYSGPPKMGMEGLVFVLFLLALMVAAVVIGTWLTQNVQLFEPSASGG